MHSENTTFKDQLDQALSGDNAALTKIHADLESGHLKVQTLYQALKQIKWLSNYGERLFSQVKLLHEGLNTMREIGAEQRKIKAIIRKINKHAENNAWFANMIARQLVGGSYPLMTEQVSSWAYQFLAKYRPTESNSNSPNYSPRHSPIGSPDIHKTTQKVDLLGSEMIRAIRGRLSRLTHRTFTLQSAPAKIMNTNHI